MAKTKKQELRRVILVDSREQRALQFDDTETEIVALAAGDYSLKIISPEGKTVDYRNRIVIERKSISDLYGCIGNQRSRFERELEKLAKLDRAAIVVEATLEQVLNGAPFSEVYPRAAIGSLFAWYARFGIAPIFAGNPLLAAATVRKILVKFAEQHLEGFRES